MKAQPQKCICPNFFKSHILFRPCRLNMRMMRRRMLFFSGGGKIKKVQRWGEEGAGWLDWEQKSILPSSNVGNDYYGDCAIAVTVVINVSAGAGRVKLIYYCGEIGICPPVQRATPLRGVGPSRRGVWGASLFSPSPTSVRAYSHHGGGWGRKYIASSLVKWVNDEPSARVVIYLFPRSNT